MCRDWSIDISELEFGVEIKAEIPIFSANLSAYVCGVFQVAEGIPGKRAHPGLQSQFAHSPGTAKMMFPNMTISRHSLGDMTLCPPRRVRIKMQGPTF
jgi:hypothetical protein